MALDNLPAFPDDMYDTAHDGAVPQPVTPRKPISPFSFTKHLTCLLYTSPSPRDRSVSRMPSSA